MKIRATLIAVLSATTLAACGGDDEEPAPAPAGGGGATEQSTPAESSGGGGSSETLALTATESGGAYGFDPKDLDAKAGAVEIDLELPGDLQAPHAIAIEGNGVNESGEVVEAGATSKVTADLQPGEYTFFCPVGDHRADGMEGTLTVE